MNVFVLGGYGKVGLWASRLLAQSDLVAKVAIAGRTPAGVERAAVKVGPKAVAVVTDAADTAVLTPWTKGYDIIVNASDSITGLPAVRAAIQGGKHYCDVTSFGDVVNQVRELDSEARASGITAVVAAGIGPCISNLMGRYMADQLDDVQQLQRGMSDFIDFKSGQDIPPSQWRCEPQQSLAVLRPFKSFIKMMFKKLSKNGIKKMRTWEDGQWKDTDPVNDGVDVPRFENGTVRSYPYASTDSFWGALPVDRSEIDPMELWFSPLPPQLDFFLREQALHMLEEGGDPETAVNSIFETVENDPMRWLTVSADFTFRPKMWIRAVGRRGERSARCTSWLTASMWNVNGYFLTSVALVAAALKILRGEVRECGVVTAEKAFDPQSFFDEVAAVLPTPPRDGKIIADSFEWLE